jgi:hypothetical protein
MKPGDYVKSIDHETNGNPETGIILSTGYNMWGEEIEGQETGVKVLWQDGDSHIVSTDELEVLSEAG